MRTTTQIKEDLELQLITITECESMDVDITKIGFNATNNSFYYIYGENKKKVSLYVSDLNGQLCSIWHIADGLKYKLSEQLSKHKNDRLQKFAVAIRELEFRENMLRSEGVSLSGKTAVDYTQQLVQMSNTVDGQLIDSDIPF